MASTPTPDPPARVFIDSSVLVAAAISQTGAARLLLTAGLTDQVTLLFSEDVFAETQRSLAKKAPAALAALQVFQEAFIDQTVRAEERTVHRAAAVVAAKDAPIVAGAIEARAAYLATFDRQHLLSVAPQIRDAFGIAVATPAEILGLDTPVRDA
jgi:predicted nucleic acid-binding protein